jgi:hypothetical protein
MSGVSATSTATELTAALRDKEVSSRELLDLYLDRSSVSIVPTAAA